MRFPVKLLQTTGWRDQSTRTTMLPWSNADLGLIGFNFVPDGGRSVVIYILPTIDRGIFELRCHATMAEPDPESDPMLGKISLPKEMMDP